MMQIDRSVTESYGGGGKTCITSRIYPKLVVGGCCSPLRLQQWIKYSEDCPAACMGNEQALNELRKTWNLEQERVLSLCQWMCQYTLFIYGKCPEKNKSAYTCNMSHKAPLHWCIHSHYTYPSWMVCIQLSIYLNSPVNSSYSTQQVSKFQLAWVARIL